jgi:hypothetical protein
MRSRSVFWFLFLILTISLVLIRLDRQQVIEVGVSSLINIGFLVTVLSLLTAYLSIKYKRMINLTNHFLGIGDVMFLFSISCYLSVYNFIFFYICSLAGTCIIWQLYLAISAKRRKYIPLAGLQSLIFILFLAGDWWCKFIDLTSDYWLLNLISK